MSRSRAAWLCTAIFLAPAFAGVFLLCLRGCPGG